MARTTAAEAAQTREELLDAALEVFWEEGVSRPSLTKVAERAGRTRGAIYGHFENKNDLFNALCDRYLMPAGMLEAMRREGADDPLGTLIEWVVRVLDDARSDRERRMLFEILFLKCEAVEGDDVWERLQQDSERVREHEQALLTRAVELGQLPADLDVCLASMVVHTMLGGQIRYFALNPTLDATTMLARMEGILTELLKGPSLRLAP